MPHALPSTQRQFVLAARPHGMVKVSDFALRSSEVREPDKGEVLVRVLVIGFDPAMRGWMEDRKSYVPPVAIGEVMRASGVGQVIASRVPGLAPGDLVQGLLGWQELALVRPAAHPMLALAKLSPGIPITWHLGVLGLTGLTAYFGMREIGRPRPGDTVVVSAAAGATGSVAAQIARIAGCRTIGIAGGPAKCAWLRDEARLDGVIDYKAGPVDGPLRELCPKGIDVYFDNVGGEILDACLARLALRARVVLCGGISGYNAGEPPPGPRNLMALVIQRARMEGFIVLDWAARFDEARRELAQWVGSGEIRHQEDVQHGFENAPATFLRLFEGKNRGKQLLQIAEPA